MANDGLVLALAAPFLAAALSVPLARVLGRAAAPVLATIPAVLFLLFATLIVPVSGGARITAGIDWLPAFGVRLSILVDGLSLLFALLITGIGALIIVYAGGYMAGHPKIGRFLAFMFLFMGAMLGLVLADDGISLFVFWEGTSIASFLLIGFDHARERARRAALQALVITGAGGLALLAAVILAGGVAGGRSMSAILASGDLLRQSTLYGPILGLVLLAAFTKSAQVPLHVWLPNAMEAPTPVSAYLHSATMVKAGVYLLMRLNPVLGDTQEWATLLPLFGGATLVTGAVLALRQTDLKLMLAQTTVASLGLLVMLIGVGGEAAIIGAAAYLLAHALFKGALFMVVGAIDHGAGSRDIRRLSGLRGAMPITFAAALGAALSMAGLPPFFGFVAKEALYAGLAGPAAMAALAAAVVANALMFGAAFAVALKPFTGEHRPMPHDHPHDGPAAILAGPIVLAVVGLAAALLTGATAPLLLEPAASAIAGRAVETHLHLIPTEIGAPLLLSLLTVLLGIAAFGALTGIRERLDDALTAIGWGPDRGFDQAVSGLLGLARFVVRTVQPGRLEAYVTGMMVLVAAALLLPMALFGEQPGASSLPMPRVHEAAVALIAVAGLGAVLAARTRLTAIVSLGVSGFAVAVLYMLFGAPDLAFTQFMVETLSVVILALVLTRLSLGERDARPLHQKLGDGALALAVGTGFGALLLAVTEQPFDRRLTDVYDATSRAIAHGRNVVNVIIVDFRGLDTLGEISVVMVTGLAILALVRVKGRRPILPRPPEDAP